MKKINFKKKYILFSLLAVVFSCKKAEIKQDEDIAINHSKLKAGVPTYNFDWETADFMPGPAGSQKVLVPWASGANRSFSAELAFDFKKKDGWVMLYNSFNETFESSPKFFTLYNKFNGLIRFYLYIPPGSPAPSSYFSDGLSIAGGGKSSILNFGNDVADITKTVGSISRIQNFQLQATGSWYLSQYELAYDPNISQLTPENIVFLWNTAATNLSSVTLNGETSGSLSGTIGTESPGGFNLGSLLGNVANGVLYATGVKGIEILKIGNKSINESLIGGAKSGLSGAVKGFFSAILGGTPTSPKVVNLTLKTKSKLEGNISNVSGITNLSLAIPGSSNIQNSAGYIPSYNKTLGVVNILQKPEIAYSRDSVFHDRGFILQWKNGGFIMGPIVSFKYRFYNYFDNKKKLVFNPELLKEGVTFKILREDIIVPCDSVDLATSNYTGRSKIEPYLEYSGFEYEPESHSGVYSDIEFISNRNFAVFGSKDPETSAVGVLTSWVWENRYVSNVRYTDNVKAKEAFIRYTILVIPPNNGMPVTIVKSFKANIKRI